MFLDDARPALLRNMYEYSPETLFVAEPGRVAWDPGGAPIDLVAEYARRC